MPTTDLQVATLRALLLQDFQEHRRMVGELGDEGMRSGYLPLLTAAFGEAVRLRFRGKKRADIIEWVADVRARIDTGDRIDPSVAERLILWVFGQASTEDIDFDTDFGHQTMLTGLLVEEQEFDDARLNEFLGRARVVADQIAM